jgi:hypothetical protein
MGLNFSGTYKKSANVHASGKQGWSIPRHRGDSSPRNTDTCAGACLCGLRRCKEDVGLFYQRDQLWRHHGHYQKISMLCICFELDRIWNSHGIQGLQATSTMWTNGFDNRSSGALADGSSLSCDEQATSRQEARTYRLKIERDLGVWSCRIGNCSTAGSDRERLVAGWTLAGSLLACPGSHDERRGSSREK